MSEYFRIFQGLPDGPLPANRLKPLPHSTGMSLSRMIRERIFAWLSATVAGLAYAELRTVPGTGCTMSSGFRHSAKRGAGREASGRHITIPVKEKYMSVTELRQNGAQISRSLKNAGTVLFTLLNEPGEASVSLASLVNSPLNVCTVPYSAESVSAAESSKASACC